MFREIYERLNSEHHFGKGIEIEVLKGFYQYIPKYKVSKLGYRYIRLSSYKSINKINNI